MWIEVGIFAAKTILVTVSILVVVGGIAIIFMQTPRRRQGLKVEKLNDHFTDLAHSVDHILLHKKLFKKKLAESKKSKKKSKQTDAEKHRIFVLDFIGDIKADAVDSLREEVSAILVSSQPQDEVLVRIESSGGVVHGYGLAAAQLERLRKAQIPVIAAVDKVAASGGYMMACVANKIIAGPFAIVGSIGVLAPVPNVHKLLKKFDVDYNEYTAGTYKRTVSVFGENTPEGVQKFKSQLEQTHVLFKKHIQQFRPQLNLEQVATGEYWYGHQGLELNLVDDLQTSDQWLLERRETHHLVKISFQRKQKWQDKLSEVLSAGVQGAFRQVLSSMKPFEID